MMRNKAEIEMMIGRECSHGSPGYPVNETIETIRYEKEGFTVCFKSGCFTELTESDFETLINDGEVCYNPWQCSQTSRAGMLEEMILLS